MPRLTKAGETWETSISTWLVEWEGIIRGKFHEKIK